MAKIGVDVSGALAKLKGVAQVELDEAEVLLTQAAEIGVKAARTALDMAETEYGRYRMSIGRGNTAGRNDTGSMINDLRALEPKISEGKAVVQVGWGRGRSKKYYEAQENGTARITGAHSLLDAERAILNELPRLERNMKARISRKTKNK
jgi:hypothetical protein